MEFSSHQINLLQRSVEHSIRSGQFFFTMSEAEELHRILEMIRIQKFLKAAKEEDGMPVSARSPGWYENDEING
jgi:hypothetical protein